jgi:hypothetical protein
MSHRHLAALRDHWVLYFHLIDASVTYPFWVPVVIAAAAYALFPAVVARIPPWSSAILVLASIWWGCRPPPSDATHATKIEAHLPLWRPSAGRWRVAISSRARRFVSTRTWEYRGLLARQTRSAIRRLAHRIYWS